MLVYLLIVVNFQSWLDPFIIITALPAAIAGIAWMLLITGTTLSVPALTGAIMCMGVATANSILVVSFARDRMQQGATALQAALDAGFTRFRPVLMTALAMIIGMLPMALGLGEGGEQNAPLGRAVIGGLLFATVATLVFVPAVFAAIHGRRAARAPSPQDATRLSPRAPQPEIENLHGSTSTTRRTCISHTACHDRHATTARNLVRPALVLGVLALLVLVWSALSAHRAAAKLKAATEAQAVITVATTQPQPLSGCERSGAAGQRAGQLRSADLRPHQRLSEALARRHRHAGEGRAAARRRSSRPKSTQQLRQAQADLATAQANEKIANVTAERWRNLRATDSVSKQEADEKISLAASNDAQVQAARANVQRLRRAVRLREDRRAVRRRRDRAQHRCRPAHRGRQQHRAGAVPHRRYAAGCGCMCGCRRRMPRRCSPGLTAELRFPGSPGQDVHRASWTAPRTPSIRRRARCWRS